MFVDNPTAVQRRLNTYAPAKQNIRAAATIAATAASKASGSRPSTPAPSTASRPASSSGGPDLQQTRKARRVDATSRVLRNAE
eukprot:9420993-Heterocapsa_arctica.AAC.1